MSKCLRCVETLKNVRANANMYFIETNKHLISLPKAGFFCNDHGESKLLAFRSSDTPHMESSLMSWCIENFCKGDKKFIDIGSHIGSWTISLGPHSKHVHAFECNKHVFNILCANIALRNLSSKVCTHLCGLSNKAGIMKYYKRNAEGGPNGIEFLRENDHGCEMEEVQVCTLDDFELENIGFLKIDVEGHEKRVLEGALETLKNSGFPPFVFESWHPRRELEHPWNVPATKLREELFAYIAHIGYRVVALSGCDEVFVAEYNK